MAWTCKHCGYQFKGANSHVVEMANHLVGHGLRLMFPHDALKHYEDVQ